MLKYLFLLLPLTASAQTTVTYERGGYTVTAIENIELDVRDSVAIVWNHTRRTHEVFVRVGSEWISDTATLFIDPKSRTARVEPMVGAGYWFNF